MVRRFVCWSINLGVILSGEKFDEADCCVLFIMLIGHCRGTQGRNRKTQHTQQSKGLLLAEVLRALESERPEIKFEFQEHLLGGVSVQANNHHTARVSSHYIHAEMVRCRHLLMLPGRH